MIQSVKRHWKLIVLASIMTLPSALAQSSNMTDSMLEMLVEIMPIMVIVMVFKMMASAFTQ